MVKHVPVLAALAVAACLAFSGSAQAQIVHYGYGAPIVSNYPGYYSTPYYYSSPIVYPPYGYSTYSYPRSSFGLSINTGGYPYYGGTYYSTPYYGNRFYSGYPYYGGYRGGTRSALYIRR